MPLMFPLVCNLWMQHLTLQPSSVLQRDVLNQVVEAALRAEENMKKTKRPPLFSSRLDEDTGTGQVLS